MSEDDLFRMNVLEQLEELVDNGWHVEFRPTTDGEIDCLIAKPHMSVKRTGKHPFSMITAAHYAIKKVIKCTAALQGTE